MKKILLFIFSILSITLFAQTSKDSTQIREYLEISRMDETKWIQRFQKDIDRYIDENRKLEDKSCDALIFGSSSIHLWKSIYTDLAPMKIIKRSYGGATIRDMIYNYDVIAREYDPKSIVLYVENDLPSKISVGDTYDLFRVFIAKIKRDYPTVPFYVISLKPSPARKPLLKKFMALNSLLEDYAANTDGVNYVDITKVMYNSDGAIKEDIFLKDKLHLNEKGYELWTAVLKPCISRGIQAQENK
jgi:lysophospholipase L1-like esterase